MPPFLTSLVGPLLEGLKGIIEEVHLDPAKKADIEQHMADLQAQAALGDQQMQEKLNEIAGQNIRQETGSENWFVAGARPAFLWMMTLLLFLNMALPLFDQLFGGHLQPLNIDAGLYGLFSSAFLGYVVARTYEKTQSK